ncbi:MAG: HD domain-containing protein [Fimbriimonadaceae bacterium]|nr:HD domain-containing protein [Fimbriimonadaceae bacterium]
MTDLDLTVRTLQIALDVHEPGERAHADRVSVYAVAMGESLGLTDDELMLLRRAAQLHDIGKMRVPADLLRRIGELTEDDLKTLRRHAEAAEEVLEDYEELRDAVPSIRHHHERWDGGGYPDGLEGIEIPIGARILAVAEAYDVLTAGAIWRDPIPWQDALERLANDAGGQFDPRVVDALRKVAPVIQPVGQS